MSDFEKLGLFYLGRRHDPAAGQTLDEPILYDSRDLVTHAVCVGMTGSGKTGLCISIIEEAALDGIPVIAIDPKGDIGNLLLTFPGLSAQEFRPWIDEDEARRAGQDPDEFSATQANLWKAGLAQWGQDGRRIERLRASADFAIYTPGSAAGRQVSVLSSFAAPAAAVLQDPEALAERAGTAATSVLTLAGAEAAPRSREHTLVSTVLLHAWREHKGVTLPDLIRDLQAPPFQKVGVVDVDSFCPPKDRFELAMQVNGLVAAPGFERWLEGEPLDPSTLLYTTEGRPRVAIFSIAHLGDAERMFFVSLLLGQIVSWMRSQTGTSSVRALVYMDEILGYFPPVAEPPSKTPLLTLLKQGRAFGIGVVLATQNPVDLDYKGLSNTGTWFLGRLQTERDKARVLEGLESAGTSGLDRATADRLLSGLGKRVFLLHNVHEEAPVVFHTRWAMSYLRGPLSRDHIRALAPKTAPASAAGAKASATHAAPMSAPVERTAADAPPILAPGIQQFFVPLAHAALPSAEAATYVPVLLGAARVSFSNAKLGIDFTREVTYSVPVTTDPIPVDWSLALPLDANPSELRSEPEPGMPRFAPVPPAAMQPKNYAKWQKAFGRSLGQREKLELWRHPVLKTVSRLGESEREFRMRSQVEIREARDAAIDELRRKYAPKKATLEERLRRAEAAVGREEEQAAHQKLDTAMSFGATVLGAILGRRTIGAGTIGRATTTARGMRRSMKEASDVKRAAETVQAVREQMQELDGRLAEDAAAITARFESNVPLEPVVLTPKRGQVAVEFVALGWMPQ
jgi:hypothetical protein